MKKSDSFLKAVVAVICAAVALYLVFAVLKSSGSGYTTYKAVRYEVGDGISTSGFVVRNETVLTSPRSIVVLTRTEGERVGKGQSVASCYTDESARELQARIDAMSEELAQMEYAYSYSGSDTNSALLDTEIVQGVQLVNTYVARQDFTAAQTGAEQLKSYVLRRFITSADAETLHARIEKTKAELEALKAQTAAASEQITVDTAGFFSGTVDGYENVLTPELVEKVTVGQLEQIGEAQKAVSPDAIGRLATEARWYYAAVVDSDSLGGCKEGDYVTVQFAYDFYNSLQMRVCRISSEQDGKRVLVLTTDRFIQTAVSCRAQSAEIVFSEISGLRVPKTAVYVNDEGESGVYILSGIRATWKSVEIIYDNGDYFIVREDKSSTANLWPEDEILLTTEALYDGKVMEE